MYCENTQKKSQCVFFVLIFLFRYLATRNRNSIFGRIKIYKMGRIVFLMVLVSIGFVSCKSNYTRIGDKDANYIPYYLKVYEADSLYLVGDYEQSYQILDSLFKKYEPLVMDNYSEYGTYLSTAALTNKTKNFRAKVKLGFVNYGGIYSLHPDKVEIYNKIIQLSNLNDRQIIKLKKKYSDKLNAKLREEILNIYNSDQEVRNREHSDHEINKIDEYNTIRIAKILEEHGFPQKKNVGSLNAFDLPGGFFYWPTLLLHQSTESKKQYLPMLYENVVKGNFEPHHYALVYDRVMMESNGNQYYGSTSCSGTFNCDLINPIKIDSIRRSIGLPHINYYNWKVKKL